MTAGSRFETLLFFGLSVAACLFIPADARCDTKTTYKVKAVKDLAYYDGSDAHKIKHKLDLYLPEGAKDFPVLFFVHGGAWKTGDKNLFGVYALFGNAYAKRGIGVVVTNYRLSPEVKHPEHAKDVARALAWTHKNIKKYGGNPGAISLCGHSAGGHLISLIAADVTFLKDLGLKTNIIKGVVPISGPFDIPDRFMTDVFDNKGKQASPISHVRKDLPPFLILYADKDMIGCDKTPAEAFCKALKGKQVTAETMEVKDSNHISILASAGTADSKVFEAIAKFVRERAK